MTTEPDNSAIRAFEALRAEVAATRAEVRELAEVTAGKTMPDYDLTLGRIAKQLGDITVRLSRIESRPVELSIERGPLKLPGEPGTPEAALHEAAETLLGCAGAVRDAVGSAATRQTQRRWLAGSALAGVTMGLMLCLGAVAVLPRQAGAWMAVIMIGAENPWDAGQALMSRGSPDSFARMVRLYRACDGKPVELCEAAISVRTMQDAPASQVRR
jgi:hypothetical protein